MATLNQEAMQKIQTIAPSLITAAAEFVCSNYPVVHLKGLALDQEYLLDEIVGVLHGALEHSRIRNGK